MSQRIARLRWNCRRGMLELDILLANFLQTQFEKLSVHDQDLFEELLRCEDQDLYVWLVVKEPPADPRFVALLEKIRGS